MFVHRKIVIDSIGPRNQENDEKDHKVRSASWVSCLLDVIFTPSVSVALLLWSVKLAIVLSAQQCFPMDQSSLGLSSWKGVN